MRKVISLVLALLMCFSFAVPASAATMSFGIVQPYYDLANEANSWLTINGSSAICESVVKGDTDVIKIVAVQTLEKQGIFWFWGTYDNTTWTKTVNSNTLAMSNTKTGIENGTYRLKTVFTLTDNQGKSETITIYSD